MRKLFILILALTFLHACEEENDINKELNVTLKSTSKSTLGIVDPGFSTRIDIYPNPFSNFLNIQFSNVINCEIYIYNYEGSGKKFVIEDELSLQLDFSSEKDGAYIIEVLIDETVYRESVIKGM